MGDVLYTGFIASSRPHPRDPNKKLWAIKIQSGPYKDQFAAVDLDNIPRGISVGMDVGFDKVVSKGPKGGLVAYNVKLVVRQQENAETKNAETENADAKR